jgi:hypothetical protein
MAALKKGSLVRVVRDKIEGSVEATASDSRLPDYIFETDGEILTISEDYAWVKFSLPVANTWFKLDHLAASPK